MKKLYLTLAVAALTTASALAIQPKEAQLQVFKISDGKVPSKEVVKRHLKNHGLATETALGKLVDGKVVTGIHTYSNDAIDSHLAKFGVNRKKIRKEAETKVNLNGNYVNFYLPFFSNQIEGKEISQGVVVTMDEENNVTFDGLCGTGVVAGGYNSNYADNKNLKGVYDSSTNQITCPGGQILAVYGGSKKLMVSPADLENGKFTSGGDLVFEVKEDGTIACTTDIYMHPEGEAGGYGAMIAPVLQAATGMISYTSSIAGAITQPIWYSITKNEAGANVVLVSGLDQYQSAGYTTEWVVNADGKTATATDQLGWSNKNSTQDLKFYLSTQNGSTYERTCTVDFSDMENIVFPANGNNWTLYDETRYWTGLNSQAKITPLTQVTPPVEPENPDDHGKGTTVGYINFFKPFFSNWDNTKQVNQVVYVTTYEDNYVEIDGLGGVGVKTCEGISSYSDVVNLHGTYDPATKTITIPGRQVLGKFAGQYDMAVFVGNEGSTSLYYGDFIFKENEDGQFVAAGEFDMIYIGAMSGSSLAGGLAGLYSPVLNRANGNIKYNWMSGSSSTGTIDEPFYYAVVTKGKKKTLLTSNLANRGGEGYSVEFVIDETAKTATATAAATYNDSQNGNFILQSSLTGSSSDLTSTVVANIADLKNIVLPAEGYWTCMTSGGTYFGWNYPAAITGTPLYIELPDDADPEKPVVAGIHYSTPAGATTAEVIGCDEGLTDLNIPAEIDVDGVKYPVVSVAEAAFQANKTITSITIPASIKTVGQDAFRNVANLKSVNIQDLAAWCAIEFANGNANPIYNVFPTSESKWGTVNINGAAVTTSLVIPEGFTSLGRSFYGFKSLTEISLPSTLVTIGDQCFANCTKLTDVVIPAAVNYVGSSFFGCSGLKSITSLAVVPPTSKSSGFYIVDKTIPVKVPAGSVDAYKAAAGWNEFTNIIANESSMVEEIESADMESAIYFDLSGRKVSGELGSGLYIRVQGNKATKVLVK